MVHEFMYELGVPRFQMARNCEALSDQRKSYIHIKFCPAKVRVLIVTVKVSRPSWEFWH